MIFLEAPAFERIRERHLDDDQYLLLQAALFLTLYHKSEMADLAQKDIKALAAIVKGLK